MPTLEKTCLRFHSFQYVKEKYCCTKPTTFNN